MAGEPNQTLGKSKEDRVESVSDVGVRLSEQRVDKHVTSLKIRGVEPVNSPLCEEVGNI